MVGTADRFWQGVAAIGGAANPGWGSNEDLALVARKTEVASQFTQSLREKGMTHAYTAADIGQARALLSAVTLSLDEAGLNKLLGDTLAQVQGASWAKVVTTGVGGYAGSMGATKGMAFMDGELVLGHTGRVSYSEGQDVYLSLIDDALQSHGSVRVGHALYSETLSGMQQDSSGGLLLWGDLDNSYRSNVDNLQFLWKLDAQMRPVAEARIGTENGAAPRIQKVLSLSNGKVLVVGQQNNVADGWDAYAVVFNADLSVHAQRRFDSPTRLTSNEKFVKAMEASNGDLVLLGEGGEMLRLNQSLQPTARALDINGRETFQLEGGLILVRTSSSAFSVVDAQFNLLGSFTNDWSYSYELTQKAPGQFILKTGSGVFQEIKLQFDTGSAQLTMETLSGKQLLHRTGGGLGVDKYLVTADNTVLSVNANHLFVFDLDSPAHPNLGADYRVVDQSFTSVFRSVRSYADAQPDWVGEDVQIVTVGVAPDAADAAPLYINSGGVVAI